MTRKLLNVVCLNILIFNLSACSNPQSAIEPNEPPAVTEDGDVASSDDSSEVVESEAPEDSTDAVDDAPGDTSSSDDVAGEPSSDTTSDVAEDEAGSASVDALKESGLR